MSPTTLAGVALCLSLLFNAVYQLMTGHPLDPGIVSQFLAAISALVLGKKATP